MKDAPGRPLNTTAAGSTSRIVPLPNYLIEYHRGDDVLWITFDHAGLPKHPANRRQGWGVPALTGAGHSVLAVKAWRTDWFLGPDMAAFFREPIFAAVRAGKTRVVLYGLSMGGFAAMAYSTLIPGSTVVAISPQTTLHPQRVPWERRFDYALGEDWDGPFGDIATLRPAHSQAFVLYSPGNRYDGQHVERIPGFQPLTRLPLPGNAHVPGGMMQESGILKRIVHAVSSGRFSAEMFARMQGLLERSAAYHFYAGSETKDPSEREDHFARCLKLASSERYDFYVQRIASKRLWLAVKTADLEAAHAACHALRSVPAWNDSVSLKVMAARSMARLGDSATARELITEIEAQHPEGHPKLPQILAMCDYIEAEAGGHDNSGETSDC